MMYVSYYTSKDTGRSWFSVNIDADDDGREALRLLQESARKIATEAVNLDRFEAARKYLNLAEELGRRISESLEAVNPAEDLGRRISESEAAEKDAADQ